MDANTSAWESDESRVSWGTPEPPALRLSDDQRRKGVNPQWKDDCKASWTQNARLKADVAGLRLLIAEATELLAESRHVLTPGWLKRASQALAQPVEKD